MDFRLSEADRVLIEHVREFGAKYFNQDTVAQWRSDMGLPDEVVRDFVNLDFNGFGVIHRRDISQIRNAASRRSTPIPSSIYKMR